VRVGTPARTGAGNGWNSVARVRAKEREDAMKRMTIAWLAALALAAPAAHAVQAVEGAGKVESVVLFRGQAQVTRLVPVTAPAGAVALTVVGLPESVVGESLSASTGADLQVRAVRFRTRAVAAAPTEEVRALEQQIAAAEKKMRANTRMQKVAVEKQAYVANLGGFVAPTTKVELSKGVLDAKALQGVTKLVFEQRDMLAAELGKLDEEARVLKEELSLLQRKRGEITRGTSKAEREAVIFLDKTGDAASTLRLTYLVQNATWSPTYNVRGENGRKTVAVEVGALVQQTSGEDWNGVALTLSTAGAQLVADGPALAPLRLHLSKAPPGGTGAGDLQKKVLSAKSSLQRYQNAQQETVQVGGQFDAQWGLNNAGAAVNWIELATDPRDLGVIRRALRETGSGLAVNYRIGGRVSLASRRDNQMVQIDRLELPATYFYETTPLLSGNVFRYAEITNTSGLSLLEGRAGVYLGGEFVGMANVPMVARGQKVTVGFGTNPQLRARREFISKEEKSHLLGSNKHVDYRYRLVLDNYSDKAIAVRVLDRIPVESEKVRVTLGDLKDGLCGDAEYLRVHRPNGILRWDVEVPAHAARGTARIVEYGFRLEFEAKLHIAPAPPPAPAAQERARFQDMMDLRRMNH
jgi:uncharacterized protein (TIGR02231 family)